MLVLKIAGLIFWLIVVPFCTGLLPVHLLPEKERTPGNIFFSGYIVMFALFELIGIPVVIMVIYDAFSLLSRIFMTVSALLALAGCAVTFVRYQRGSGLQLWSVENGRRKSLEEMLYYLIFILLVGFQMYMAFTRASFDGDDAYYGVQGLIAQQQDVLYRINPNTGRSSPLDVRHALALFPVWEAFLGRMSGIHMTIIAHSVAPLILIPLTYLVYFQAGGKLFADKKDMLPVFLIFMALFQMFGNVSIYTSETFFLTRTWQGKSVAGNFMIPAVFLIFLCLFAGKDKEEQFFLGIRIGNSMEKTTGYYLLLACLNLASGISSSLAVLLSVFLTAGLSFLFAVRRRKFSIFLKGGLTCIPGAAYILTYLIISH